MGQRLRLKLQLAAYTSRRSKCLHQPSSDRPECARTLYGTTDRPDRCSPPCSAGDPTHRRLELGPAEWGLRRSRIRCTSDPSSMVPSTGAVEKTASIDRGCRVPRLAVPVQAGDSGHGGDHVDGGGRQRRGRESPDSKRLAPAEVDLCLEAPFAVSDDGFFGAVGEDAADVELGGADCESREASSTPQLDTILRRAPVAAAIDVRGPVPGSLLPAVLQAGRRVGDDLDR